MNLTRESEPADVYTLKNSLKALDLTLTDYKALKVAKLVLAGK
jgi:hypothetical protein